MRTLPFTEESLDTAAGCLLGGGVVILPTETVYEKYVKCTTKG